MGYPRCFEDIKEICERIGAFQDPKVCCPFIIFLIILACLAHCYVKLDGAAGGPDANFGENASLTESFWSTQYQTSLLLASIIAIPMALDLVVDAFGLDRRNSVQMVTWFAKVVFVTSLTVPNLLTYLGTFRQNDSLGAHHCMIMYVKVAAHGCICILISELNQRRGTAYLCMTAVLCYTAATHLYIRLQVDHDPALQYTPIIFYTLTYCQLIYIFFQWIFYWIFEGRKMDSDDVCFIIYFTGLLVISVGDFIITTTTQGRYTPTSLSMQNYLFMLLLLIIMACPGQIVRFNLRKVLRKMEEKEAFIRYISHEIRTPLNTVFLGMSYIKGELMGIAPLVSEYVEPILDTVNEVNNCCEVALSIVNDLLTFDKLEEGKMNLELKETDVKQYLRETVRPFDIQARDKDISITFAVDGLDLECDQAKVLRVDQHKMSQVIRNLVSNALKFTPPDGTIVITLSKVKVHVASARRGSFVRGSTLSHPKVAAKTKFTRYLKKLSNNYITQLKSGLKKKNSYRGPGGIRARSATGVRGELHVDYLRIEVTDSGAGISEENQKRLFGQYVQFNAGKLQEGNGSGLGLWISKGITELHGGNFGSSSFFFLQIFIFTSAVFTSFLIITIIH